MDNAQPQKQSFPLKWVLIYLILAVLIFAGVFYILSFLGKSSTGNTPTANQSLPPDNIPSEAPIPLGASVIYAPSGFGPQTVTIKVGESVTWYGTDAPLNVASDPHPQHSNYSPLNLGEIKQGTTKSLSFPTAGTYTYHNHLNPEHTGTITVE